MFINHKIDAYLKQSNIEFFDGDYKTAQPEGEADQIIHWHEKLGSQPTVQQLDAAWASYVSPTPPAPTKEQLLAELQALTAKINALG
jgi:hypothetical protein